MIARRSAIAVPLAAGAATALALGVYAASHEPTGRDFVVTGFSSVGAWKSALASLVLFLFAMQISLGLRITGRAGPWQPAPPWAADLHRLIGTVAFGLSIPVVFHCVWSLGYRSGDARLVTHSILGCGAYGLYVAKILAARRHDRPEWALPLAGSLLGIAMLVVWWSSALIFYVERS